MPPPFLQTLHLQAPKENQTSESTWAQAPPPPPEKNRPLACQQNSDSLTAQNRVAMCCSSCRGVVQGTRYNSNLELLTPKPIHPTNEPYKPAPIPKTTGPRTPSLSKGFGKKRVYTHFRMCTTNISVDSHTLGSTPLSSAKA